MNGGSETNPTPSGAPPETSPTARESKPVVRRRGGRRRTYVAIGAVVVVVILVAVGAVTSWYGLEKGSAACPSGITLQGDGAAIALPLMGVWTTSFQSSSGSCVNYPGTGSGTGLTKFTDKSVDFAMTDDPLSANQTKDLPAPALTLPFIGGALAIIYNLPGVSGHLNLTGAVLTEIYNGSVTTWNNAAIVALNPGASLPSQTIVPVVRSDSAGTTFVLSDFLSQSSPWWAKNVGKGISIKFPHVAAETAERGNPTMITTVTGTEYSIGYSDLTDVLESAPTPQYAAIQNPAENYIVPTLANTEQAIADKVHSMTTIPASNGNWYGVSMVNANGSADYPLATFLYMFVYQATDQGFAPTLEKSEVLVAWLNWTLTKGQTLADQTSPIPLYYAPLPAPILAVDRAGIQTMTFDGASIPTSS
jgi:phosphate ABC transporter phosphate-binding protein